MRFLKYLLLLLLVAPALAQTTNLTATITDSDGSVWANATFTIKFIPVSGTLGSQYTLLNGTQFAQATSGITNGSGVLSAPLTDLNQIKPSGGYWQATICPNASVTCQGVSMTQITGASLDLSSFISGNITAPRFPPGSGSYGYADAEVSLKAPGSTYFNVVNTVQRVWTGSAWTNTGGGSNTVNSPTTALTGQVPVAVNGASPAAWADLAVVNAQVTGASQTIACDSSTTTGDRGKSFGYNSSSAQAVTVPDVSTAACTNFFVVIDVEGAGIVTFSASGSNTFTVVRGAGAIPITGLTSFQMYQGEHAKLVSGDNATFWKFIVTSIPTVIASPSIPIDGTCSQYQVPGCSNLLVTATNGSPTVTCSACFAHEPYTLTPVISIGSTQFAVLSCTTTSSCTLCASVGTGCSTSTSTNFTGTTGTYTFGVFPNNNTPPQNGTAADAALVTWSVPPRCLQPGHTLGWHLKFTHNALDSGTATVTNGSTAITSAAQFTHEPYTANIPINLVAAPSPAGGFAMPLQEGQIASCASTSACTLATAFGGPSNCASGCSVTFQIGSTAAIKVWLNGVGGSQISSTINSSVTGLTDWSGSVDFDNPASARLSSSVQSSSFSGAFIPNTLNGSLVTTYATPTTPQVFAISMNIPTTEQMAPKQLSLACDSSAP